MASKNNNSKGGSRYDYQKDFISVKYISPIGQKFYDLKYREISEKSEKKHHSFIFPEKNGTRVQTLGTKGSKFSFEFKLVGGDHHTRAEEFSKALNEPGVSILVIPYRDRVAINVIPVKHTRTNKLTKGGNISIFVVDFIVTTERYSGTVDGIRDGWLEEEGEPEEEPNPEEEAKKAFSKLKEFAGKIGDAYSAVGDAIQNVTDLVDGVRNMVAFIKEKLDFKSYSSGVLGKIFALQDSIALAVSDFQSVTNSLDILAAQILSIPGQFAAQVSLACSIPKFPTAEGVVTSYRGLGASIRAEPDRFSDETPTLLNVQLMVAGSALVTMATKVHSIEFTSRSEALQTWWELKSEYEENITYFERMEQLTSSFPLESRFNVPIGVYEGMYNTVRAVFDAGINSLSGLRQERILVSSEDKSLIQIAVENYPVDSNNDLNAVLNDISKVNDYVNRGGEPLIIKAGEEVKVLI